MPIEQSKSKQVQDVNLVKSHVLHKILLPNWIINLSKTKEEIPKRNILGTLITKLHIRQRKILGSKLVRRVNPTRLVKRKIPSMCRLPPNPLDRQISTHNSNEERVSYRPPPKPPYLLNVDGEVIGIIGKEKFLDTVPNCRPPPKLPQGL